MNVYRMHINFYHYGLAFSLVWTIVVSSSLAWSIFEKSQEVEEMARIYGRTAFAKDLTYRDWAADIGGVYAFSGEKIMPNPYLKDIPERDIQVHNGRSLTLINPAYLVRLVSELAAKKNQDILSHITSNNPVRPENAPDPWEALALKSLESGITEVSEIQYVNNAEYMRVMKPLIMTASCAKCHAEGIYPLGSVRGAMSEFVLMEPLRSNARTYMIGTSIIHFILWGLGCLFFIFAVTRFTQYQESITVLVNAVDQSPSSIMITDAHGNIEYVNRKFGILYGFTNEEVIGKTPRIIKSEFGNDIEYDVLWKTITSGSEWNGEFHNKKKDGDHFWISASIAPVFDNQGSIKNFIGIQSDITDLKLAEAEILQQKERAESANFAKSRFLATTSHELRTPLNAIIGFSEILMGNTTANKSTQQCCEYINYIHDSARHLLLVINDILDLSKIEAGKYNLEHEWIDLPRLIQSSLQTVKSRAEAGRVHTSLEGTERILKLWADERALRQILLNLLSNAVKFTPPDGKVVVRVTKSDEGLPIIEVCDTGIGIADEDVSKVLEPFCQADNELTRQFEGTGLGLSVANSLMQLEHGKLEITSRIGVGTTVRLLFGPESLLAHTASET